MINDAMKIEYLYMENFECILSGLKKSIVEIDLSHTTHKINVIIGRMGSGKTFILSHMQPFATVGTLDVRNQDDQVVAGKDGLKIIIYKYRNSRYEIRHEYIWNEKAENHTTKSYVDKDGEELNPTGNVTSFKYIIATEFGLDQNFLRLLRLGPNVCGFLELSTTERKNYVALLLEDADMIIVLNKKFREALRAYNAQLTVLSNKLNQIGLSKETDYNGELEDLNDKYFKIENDIKELQSSILKYEAEIHAITPAGYQSFMRDIDSLLRIYDTKRDQRDELQSRLLRLEGNSDSNAIAKRIGNIESDINSTKLLLSKLQDKYETANNILQRLNEKIMIMENDSHLALLKERYTELKTETDGIWQSIRNFNCSHTSSYLKSLVNDLNGINILIDDISQYDSDMIKHIYLSDASVVGWARQKGEILTGRKINLQKKINNLSYSATYSPVSTIYTPIYCPTENCPYKKTHPYTLTKGKTSKELNAELAALQDEIQNVDKLLYRYAEYPTLYTKVSSLKEKLKGMMPILSGIGCLLSENALQIMTRLDKRTWYNYDKIIDTQELALKKESYYELLDTLRRIEIELKSYESDSLESLRNQYEMVENDILSITNEMRDANDKITNLSTELQSLYELYDLMLQKAIDEDKLKDINRELDDLSARLSDMNKSADKIAPYEKVIANRKLELSVSLEKREKISKERNQLSAKINDLNFTKREMEDVLLHQKYLNLMVDATSAKEGIPLELINDFVMGCKDIVNELIFDIFEEDIELEKFIINEKDFYVPYSINGKYIQDVIKASQGQRGLFSIAISFAFVQQSGIPYNIPLLDETDGPLHKREQGKYLSLILKQMSETGSIQSFLITHRIVENVPVNFIATTEEDVNLQNGSTLIKLYD